MRANNSKPLSAAGAEGEAGPAPLPVLMFSWCGACARQVRVLTAREAAARACVSTSTIYRWAGAGRIHAAATEQGSLVCSESLYPVEH
jgi:excisionase family DNA binding protein